MEILVTPQNEQEQKVLIAFLESLHYEYTSIDVNLPSGLSVTPQTLKEYNTEIAAAEAEYQNGQSLTAEELKKEMGKW
jgi:hypothetical protein